MHSNLFKCFSGYSLKDLNIILSLNFLIMSLIYFYRFCIFVLHAVSLEKYSIEPFFIFTCFFQFMSNPWFIFVCFYHRYY